MTGFLSTWASGLLLILVVCLASSFAARLSVGSRCQRLFQSLFIACLLLVGVLTAVGLTFWPMFLVQPAATFALMVLMATCDFGRSRRAPASAW